MTLPKNGCDCSKDKKNDGQGCQRTHQWLKYCYDGQYNFIGNYKLY